MNDEICSGSHLNNRSFKEDDYWESFQSTIVSGQVMSVDQTVSDAGELNTLIEEEMSPEKTLNMNLDAIPDFDPDNYLDCPDSVKSPADSARRTQAAPLCVVISVSQRPYVRPAQLYLHNSPPHSKNNTTSNNINCQASPRKQRPESARRISPSSNFDSTKSASIELLSSSATRTGSMLVQMIDDFKNLIDHAHSSPIISSDSGNPSTSGSFAVDVSSSLNSVDKVRKTLDFENAETLAITSEPSVNQEVDASARNKENFFDGKYSKYATLRREPMEKKSSRGSPLKVWTRKGKVALLTQYFQNQATNDSMYGRSASKSRIPLPIRKSSQMLSHVKKSPRAKSRDSGSPRYQTRKSYKLVSSRNTSMINHPSTSSTFSSSGGESFLKGNQRKLARTVRIQSCSDATNADVVSIDETCKTHSTGDLPTSADFSASSIKALNSSKITMRKYSKKKNETPSSQKKLPSAKRPSAIQNRKSVGAQLKKNSSPVKPVTEIRKIFTPSKLVRLTVKQNPMAIPKIIITRQ